jgi:hypothetical protein
MTFEPKTTELLTWANVPDGTYEVWSTPQRGAAYRVYFVENDVVIIEHPFATETQARTFFERAVEAKSQGETI